MGADLNRIREIGEGEPAERSAFFNTASSREYARAVVRDHLWTSGQVRAIRAAAVAGITLADLVEAVEEARREVTAGRG